MHSPFTASPPRGGARRLGAAAAQTATARPQRTAVVSTQPTDTDFTPPPRSILHTEIEFGPPVALTTARLVASASGTVPLESGSANATGSTSSDSDDESDVEMPRHWMEEVRGCAVTRDTGLTRAHAKHAATLAAATAATNAAVAAAAAAAAKPGIATPIPPAARSAAELAAERAEALWTQRQKWRRVMRRALEMEDTTAAVGWNTREEPSTSAPSPRSGFVCYASANPAQVRRLISRGIPAGYRGYIWQQLSGACDPVWRAAMMAQQFQLPPSSDQATLSSNNSDEQSAAPPKPILSSLSPVGAYHRILREASCAPVCLDQIQKDLNRTFPHHAFFADRCCSLGQNSLFHVLKAYAAFDYTCGYCQGMGYIVGALLQYCPSEEDAFWLFVCLLHHPRYGRLRGLFLDEMPKLNALFYVCDQILAKELPSLASHFAHSGLHLSMFASTWFMTLYAGSAVGRDFETLSRIWDVLMWHGGWWLVKIAIGILKEAEKHLIGHTFEHCLTHLKYLQATLPADRVIENALLVVLDYAECERWELDFMKGHIASAAAHVSPPASPAAPRDADDDEAQETSTSSLAAVASSSAVSSILDPLLATSNILTVPVPSSSSATTAPPMTAPAPAAAHASPAAPVSKLPEPNYAAYNAELEEDEEEELSDGSGSDSSNSSGEGSSSSSSDDDESTSTSSSEEEES